MGNLCGKLSSKDDPFSTPGRTLDSAPPPSSTTKPISTIPSTHKVGSKVGGPARTLGGQSQADDVQKEDARKKAAEAAEARFNAANKPKGKLAGKLQEQKKQTRTDTLEAASAEQRRQREVDAQNEQQTYN